MSAGTPVSSRVRLDCFAVFPAIEALAGLPAQQAVVDHLRRDAPGTGRFIAAPRPWIHAARRRGRRCRPARQAPSACRIPLRPGRFQPVARRPREVHGFRHVGCEYAVDDETRRAGAFERQLADALGECETDIERLLFSVLAANHFDQRQHRDRIEKVQPDKSPAVRPAPCAIPQVEYSTYCWRAARRVSSSAAVPCKAPAWPRDFRRSPRSQDRHPTRRLRCTSARRRCSVSARLASSRTRFSNSFCARAIAGSMYFCSRSCSVTVWPRSAHQAAMSPPMTPAPTT